MTRGTGLFAEIASRMGPLSFSIPRTRAPGELQPPEEGDAGLGCGLEPPIAASAVELQAEFLLWDCVSPGRSSPSGIVSPALGLCLVFLLWDCSGIVVGREGHPMPGEKKPLRPRVYAPRALPWCPG